jgi:hypothetical protein
MGKSFSREWPAAPALDWRSGQDPEQIGRKCAGLVARDAQQDLQTLAVKRAEGQERPRPSGILGSRRGDRCEANRNQRAGRMRPAREFVLDMSEAFALVISSVALTDFGVTLRGRGH